MPISRFDPFFNADQARRAAGNAQRSPEDMTFLRAFFQEARVELNDCEIVSATYLAWHESLFKSGVRFEEHSARLGMPNCKMDNQLQRNFSDQQERASRSQIEFAVEEEQKRNKNNLLMASGAGLSVVVVGTAWLLLRRRSIAAINSSKNARSQPDD